MTSIRRPWIAAFLFVLWGVAQNHAVASTPPGQDAPIANPSLADVEQGKQTFETRCSTCHGLDGGGAMGPNIQGIPMRLGAPAVANVIRNGMSGGMPPFAGQLDAAQIQQLIAYLLTLTYKDVGKVTGDPAKGREVYEASGCANCHTISGEGGNAGPELTKVGQLRGAGYLRNAVLYPGTDLPQERVFLETGGLMEYLFVHVVTKGGEALDGTRVAEDSFRIVLKDAKGNFHSYQKADLRELKKEPGRSLMPSAKDKLSAAQLDDLVAYLSSLKGAQ
ncbi:MAG TPA: c-type cytochrome [Candidatus Acidoferrales bacterium]|nr:c-type cytochrome [Candidatus Acidoferrales bacterium]